MEIAFSSTSIRIGSCSFIRSGELWYYAGRDQVLAANVFSLWKSNAFYICDIFLQGLNGANNISVFS